MITRSSAEIRQNYNEIADICRKTSEPVFLTNNGEEELVVMDIESYRRIKMQELRRQLDEVEEARKQGSRYYTVEEVGAFLDEVIERASQSVPEESL
ncbi:MAG: type II toxin-antitoxin system Phd/YefM family antitoxin [Oscillospiraceae bacterium]|nr:type II toxin-antitoxin system Phd/YefM family antitoxin [Ruminococcus sp.]MCD8345409.1 type II toxin-antitoxin system Phd/YefM family antitoxin [Oscillospiraceae bacterium]